MDISLARTFLEVVRSGSLIAASEQLHVTQAAVTARIQSLVPGFAWRITSTGPDDTLADEAWFRPSCVIDWEVYVGTFQGLRETQDEHCGFAYTDPTFTDILGGNNTANNCSLGIGQNNNGAYCSIRMGSCNCTNDSCETLWADEPGLATPCTVFDYADYVVALWAL